MTGKSPPPKGTPPKESRDDRLKAALKANMARRKAQARARNGEKTSGSKNEGS
ncbi:hypothetical protein [Marimonas lutisalis]|uniref:hypothetical protein n=1 Tax=Marimonas lutisalis TaxID=2545756 RepID=UPI00147742C1|nr:hypothetical protein [Marimonas lutisalis]